MPTDPVTAAHNAAIDAAAEVARCQFDERSRMRSDNMDYVDGYDEACKGVATAILALRRPDPPAATVEASAGEPWDGMPSNPDAEGWHWVQDLRGIREPQLLLWQVDEWWNPDPGCEGTMTFHRVVTSYRYLGPCTPPAPRSEQPDVPTGANAGREIAVLRMNLKAAKLANGIAGSMIADAVAERDAARTDLAAAEARARDAERMRELAAEAATRIERCIYLDIPPAPDGASAQTAAAIRAALGTTAP